MLNIDILYLVQAFIKVEMFLLNICTRFLVCFYTITDLITVTLLGFENISLSLVKLHIFQIKKSLMYDLKKHHGREHS